MISVTTALNALQEKKLIESWEMKKTKEYDFVVTTFKVVSDKVKIGDETFGKKSYLYFNCGTPDVAKEVYKALVAVGGKPGMWNGGLAKGYMDLRVHYFKGSRHWE